MAHHATKKRNHKINKATTEIDALIESAEKVLGDDHRLSYEELSALYPTARDLSLVYGRISETYLQRKLNIGFSDARILTSRMKAEGLFQTESAVEPVITPRQEIPLDINRIIADEVDWRRKQMHLSPLEEELYKIDTMDGSAFESWCAELLKRNGFVNVSPTGKSGDQGVDVLAEKDGIKYAIQCKCYSKDLGNTPVQEVSTGKQIYRCHVGAVMTNRYFTKGAIDAATATGTLLWDRDWLIERMTFQR